MVFCDVGNTFLHFFYKGKMWRDTADKISRIRPEVRIFYISVSKKSEQKLLKAHKNCVNLAPYFDINTEYSGLGIDRIAACVGVQDGIIIDAGSAITIDVMQFGVHLGGCIMPGLESFKKMYGAISPILEKEFDLSVDVDALPQDTKAAMSYGVIKSIILMIKNCSNGKKLYFTGGDGKYFCKFFDDGIYDSTLVFKGMQKAYSQYLKIHNVEAQISEFEDEIDQKLNAPKVLDSKLDSKKDAKKSELVRTALQNIRNFNKELNFENTPKEQEVQGKQEISESITSGVPKNERNIFKV